MHTEQNIEGGRTSPGRPYSIPPLYHIVSKSDKTNSRTVWQIYLGTEVNSNSIYTPRLSPYFVWGYKSYLTMAPQCGVSISPCNSFSPWPSIGAILGPKLIPTKYSRTSLTGSQCDCEETIYLRIRIKTFKFGTNKSRSTVCLLLCIPICLKLASSSDHMDYLPNIYFFYYPVSCQVWTRSAIGFICYCAHTIFLIRHLGPWPSS